MDQEKIIVSPDEANAEQEALAGAKEDEIRSRIVSELGLSEDDQADLIENLVQREIGHKTKLSEAIGQKIKWRAAAAKGKPPAPVQEKKEATPTFDPETIRKQTETTVVATLEQRDLDEMDYPDEIKADIKKLAQLQGVSVRKAAQDPYIQHRIAEAGAADRVNEAATTRTPRSTTASTDTPPKFDMSTDEGRKAFKEWKESNKGS